MPETPRAISPPIEVTIVIYDPETDGVAVKHDGEVVWREQSLDSLDQYLRFKAPIGVPVTLRWSDDG